ncbi:hypothetical protein Cgig2_028522 [Carnegiea gigantea]|uniref:Uncharacterized protein n=1 Tax=Carnegiea gigantea TaxID=171969 RepID=A0A9Q1GTC5_9CARY|nr:hypothetical protein Cgig2_028522 [Carnegiea gigantea]
MLNANVNRLMKHVVDNKTMKSNKHMTGTCATTYIAHPSKSSEKKESPIKFENANEMIVAEYNFLKDDMKVATELTKSISVGGLNFLHKEDEKVNMNKSNDFRRELAKDLVRIGYLSHLVLITIMNSYQVYFKDGKVHRLLIVVDHLHKKVRIYGVWRLCIKRINAKCRFIILIQVHKYLIKRYSKDRKEYSVCPNSSGLNQMKNLQLLVE